jgi:nuclear transport factor 2 (NTF2) superfamily protein
MSQRPPLPPFDREAAVKKVAAHPRVTFHQNAIFIPASIDWPK